ncbi:MAG: AraC family transcriptional regulator [Clostridiales bacterium]|nr:AraC family transcriptional regulator [Clostridiales bacterium]
MKLCDTEPYIRFVNNYKPAYSYAENKRIIYDFEFMYVMEGGVDMHSNGSYYRLKKYDLFLIRPGIDSHITVNAEDGFRTHCIHFDWTKPDPEYDFSAENAYLHPYPTPEHQKWLEFLKTRPTPEPDDVSIPCYMPDMPSLAPVFSRCYHAYIKNSKLLLKSAFFEILHRICTVNAADSIEPIHPKVLYAAEYIKENYTMDITTPMLAKKYGLSPKYFGVMFKNGMKKSVRDFLMEQRLFCAKEMLIGTNMSIEEISRSCGFSNPFYFSKCFKDAQKLSPSRYRASIHDLC